MNNQMTIQQQLNEFYQTNNFGDEGGANETWVWFKFGPISLPLYNLSLIHISEPTRPLF
jgi:hypothetical protein